MSNLRSAVAVLGAALLLAAHAAHAQEANFPSRPITLMVGFAPGGGTDQIARLLAPKVGELLKQTIIIENKAGASGTLAAAQVAKASPDGYTLLMGHVSSNAMVPAIKSKMLYNAAVDFTPLTVIGSVPLVVTVPAASPAKSIKDFIQLTKAQPGKFNYASSGVGTQQHFAAELFELDTGAKMTHVPYKGSGAAVTDLIAGQVDVNFDTLPSVLPHIQAGKLRALAVTTRERQSLLPGIPTLIEAGLPEYDIGAWYMVMGPAKLPPALVEKISSAFIAAARDPATRARLNAISTDVVASTPDQARKYLASEIDRWSHVAKTRNIHEE